MKDKKTTRNAGPASVPGGFFIPSDGELAEELRPLTEDERREREMLPNGMPRALVRVRDYLENGEYWTEDEQMSVEYGDLGAWSQLDSLHVIENKKKLLEMIRRLESASNLKDHWLRLYAEVSKARQIARKERRPIRVSFDSIIVTAMVAALTPIARTPAKEIEEAVKDVKESAEKLSVALRHLEEIGFYSRRFLPRLTDVTDDSEDDVISILFDAARFQLYEAYRRYQKKLGTKDVPDKEIVAEAIVGVVGQTDAILATLDIVADRTKQYLNDGVARRSATGDHRLGLDLARELVRRFKLLCGAGRYTRAAAIASAATGEHVTGKSVEVMLGRERRRKKKAGK